MAAFRFARMTRGRWGAFGVGLMGVGMGMGQTEASAFFWDSKPKLDIDLKKIRTDLEDVIADELAGPEFVRLAWHASGTYNKKTGDGGNHGTMDKAPERDDGANAGLGRARGLLAKIHAKYPGITKADLWVLASLVAIDEMGGPKIPFYYGRTDAAKCPPTGRLPDASKAHDHIRDVFTGQYGFNDQEIVALIGAHALGRCNKDRSGYDGPWTNDPYGFSNSFFVELLDRTWQIKPSSKGTPNEQYEDAESKKLMMLPADMALTKDAEFMKWVKAYYADNDKFCEDFSKAYVKLMNLGYDTKALGGPTTDY
eukprot:TRINITY_DN149_c5_g1_i1.p1 TRINITY_DN149_c5_g1~~TRINITY_DN149_c5_g1_i1.p1  ORF type:complete len:330 (+),score=88.73 TRINITY_DN149_c5_g1_i1:59-991(+)